MTEDFSIACIKWDQKLGGVLDCVGPDSSFKITPATAMNLYNIHRVTSTDPNFGTLRLRLENGEKYNVCTFFTGYGASTSPDGYTANYGGNTIGIAERVLAFFLPSDCKADDYDEVLAKISSRVIIDSSYLEKRINQIAQIIKKSSHLKNVNELHKFLDSRLDRSLGLSIQEIARANEYEVKILHYLVLDKREYIRELAINPAKSAYVNDQRKIAEAEEKRSEIQALIKQITQMSSQKEMTEALSFQKDEVIENLKADYIKIFGTLTDQIMQLENEINGITESTQALVSDLNNALAEKIEKIRVLEEKINTLHES